MGSEMCIRDRSCLSTQSYIPLICLLNIQETGGSTIGGGLRSIPETRSPTTPIHGGGGGGGLGGTAAASNDDLGFGGLGGDDLRGARRPGA